jgi:hypothetical protein
VTRAEAERRCAELNSGDGPGHWMVQEIEGGEWRAVAVQLPGLEGTRGPLTESTVARPRPEAEDPRQTGIRDIAQGF